MQNKIEFYWFRQSKHGRNPVVIIQIHSTSKFAKKPLKFKINKPNKKSQQKLIVFSTLENKMGEMHNGMPSK